MLTNLDTFDQLNLTLEKLWREDDETTRLSILDLHVPNKRGNA